MNASFTTALHFVYFRKSVSDNPLDLPDQVADCRNRNPTLSSQSVCRYNALQTHCTQGHGCQVERTGKNHFFVFTVVTFDDLPDGWIRNGAHLDS
ncbi:hypothetical protein NPIL_660121 [Nephila pilipes]|uniref:Uncharacterized protein n=1 Tax=Nephila pilipes TaxID=299642 RepID=A0A8X6IIL9_NEPPI|nr:hypothetical protein NPIL_660121 [Nephila pilipes]